MPGVHTQSSIRERRLESRISLADFCVGRGTSFDVQFDPIPDRVTPVDIPHLVALLRNLIGQRKMTGLNLRGSRHSLRRTVCGIAQRDQRIVPVAAGTQHYRSAKVSSHAESRPIFLDLGLDRLVNRVGEIGRKLDQFGDRFGVKLITIEEEMDALALHLEDQNVGIGARKVGNDSGQIFENFQEKIRFVLFSRG